MATVVILSNCDFGFVRPCLARPTYKRNTGRLLMMQCRVLSIHTLALNDSIFTVYIKVRRTRSCERYDALKRVHRRQSRASTYATTHTDVKETLECWLFKGTRKKPAVQDFVRITHFKSIVFEMNKAGYDILTQAKIPCLRPTTRDLDLRIHCETIWCC